MDGTPRDFTPAQHMRALQVANEVRLARSRLKKDVGRGEVSAAEVIGACPWEARTMTVAELLDSQARWGGKRCRSFLGSISMSETRKIGELTERERNRLIQELSPKEARPDRAATTPLWPAWGGRVAAL
jgi:hypothetical protein